jgi:hypothetical protein
VVAGFAGKYDKNLINLPPQFISLGQNKETSNRKKHPNLMRKELI